MRYVAVYGTLRKGGQNHQYIEHLCGEYVYTVPVLDFPAKLIVNRLPMLITTEDRWPVLFEIYKVYSLGLLDVLEGHPRFYERRLTEIGGYDCWVYYYINTNNSININNYNNIYDYIYYINTNNNKIAQDNTNVKSN